jgi:hypothetical protein
MKVKELILQLLEFPQDAEVVCYEGAGGYLAPYKVDCLSHFSASNLDGIQPAFYSSNDAYCRSEDVVFAGTCNQAKRISKKFFPFKEFFKPGSQRTLR